jgi:hypothetical protein
MDGYWHSALNRKPTSGPGDARPLRSELLPITGAISDSRARTIDPRDYERRLPKRIAVLALLVIVAVLWAILWTLCKLLMALLVRAAEPVAGIIAGLLGAAVVGMFLIGIGLLG